MKNYKNIFLYVKELIYLFQFIEITLTLGHLLASTGHGFYIQSFDIFQKNYICVRFNLKLSLYKCIAGITFEKVVGIE